MNYSEQVLIAVTLPAIILLASTLCVAVFAFFKFR